MQQREKRLVEYRLKLFTVTYLHGLLRIQMDLSEVFNFDSDKNILCFLMKFYLPIRTGGSEILGHP